MWSPTFVVFDSRTGPKSKGGPLIYCSSKDAKVQWPSLGKRGRPRKNQNKPQPQIQSSSDEIEGPRKERYGFVDCSNGQQSKDPKTRKFVRTHVMHDNRRQKQIAAKAELEIQTEEVKAGDKDADKSTEAGRPFPSPERWGRDPFDSFPIKMQSNMHDLLNLFITAFGEHFYPIEAHWGFSPTQKVWAPLALTDPALLHAILFGGDQFGARLNSQKERPSAIGHLKHAIQILDERLRDTSQEISDSTIATVASIALTEQSGRNYSNWSVHMRGLKRMVDLRGGLKAFECNSVMHDKLCRADICGSISGFSKPYLHIERESLQSTFPRSHNETNRTLAPGFQKIHVQFSFEAWLFEILYEVRFITYQINTVDPPKSEITPMRLRARIRSIQYYLLSKKIIGSGVQLAEACRLGVLLYLGIIQNEFWIVSMYKQLIWELKSSLQRESVIPDSMRLWLLFLSGSLTLDVTDRVWFVCSIAQTASQLSLFTWDDTKVVLGTFAWAAKAQDRSGKDLWNEAMVMQNTS